MVRRASYNQQKLIGADALLELFIEKFKNYSYAKKAGYAEIYPAIVDWLSDHGNLYSEEAEELLEGYYG